MSNFDPTNFERASWGQAALNAANFGATAADILLAYCEEKTGDRDLYEEPDLVAGDAACDSLHALMMQQCPHFIHVEVVEPTTLDLSAWEHMLQILAPEVAVRQRLREGAIETNLEEQQEWCDENP